MSISPLDALFEAGKLIIERIWPDPHKRAVELRKLEEMKQRGELAEMQAYVELMKGQMEINKEEAKHTSIFVAGWRPFIGWVGGISLAYQFVVYPLLIWIWAILQANGTIAADLTPPPVLDTGALFTILTGMLGIGAMRSWEKKQGVAKDSLKK